MAAYCGCGCSLACRLVKDCSETSGLQAQAMDSLQDKLKTLQSAIDQEKAAFVQAKVLTLVDVLLYEHVIVIIVKLNFIVAIHVLCINT